MFDTLRLAYRDRYANSGVSIIQLLCSLSVADRVMTGASISDVLLDGWACHPQRDWVEYWGTSVSVLEGRVQEGSPAVPGYRCSAQRYGSKEATDHRRLIGLREPNTRKKREGEKVDLRATAVCPKRGLPRGHTVGT